MNKEKKSAEGMIRILKLVWKEYKVHVIFVIIGILGSAIATVQGSLFLEELIDSYIAPLLTAADPDFGPLITALMQLAGIYLAGVACSYMYNRIMVNVSQGIMRKVRRMLFDRMESLPIRYFDTHSHGDIMSIYTNDTDTLRQFLSQSITQVVNSAVTIISVFCAMVMVSVPLTVVTLVMVAAMLFVTRKVAGLSSRYFVKQQNDLGTVNGYIEEMMGGQKVVKVFCHEDKSLEDFRKVNGNLMDSARKANTYGNILMPVIAQLGNVSYVVCAVVGAALALNGYTGLTLGMLVSFLTLNKNFNQPFAQVSQQINSVVMAMAGIGRIFELMDEEPEKDEGYVQLVNAQRFPDGSVTETEKRTGLWAWKHYHKADNTTTYVELKGDIVLDGVDFGYTDDKMVLQDTHLFTGTIIENIRYGKLDATDEECIAAAKLANADGFIHMLPEGYDTVITGDGGSLSQGQRQLLAIARAAVADPPVLILDEATSSIDTHTEELVQKGMDSLMRGRTAFVIAHRLRTIEGCDSVYQLRDGKIMNIRQEVLQD
ncbi:MAG: ABC transporter ATP-binding protein [Mediterraneibacter sp.]